MPPTSATTEAAAAPLSDARSRRGSSASPVIIDPRVPRSSGLPSSSPTKNNSLDEAVALSGRQYDRRNSSPLLPLMKTTAPVPRTVLLVSPPSQSDVRIDEVEEPPESPLQESLTVTGGLRRKSLSAPEAPIQREPYPIIKVHNASFDGYRIWNEEDSHPIPRHRNSIAVSRVADAQRRKSMTEHSALARKYSLAGVPGTAADGKLIVIKRRLSRDSVQVTAGTNSDVTIFFDALAEGSKPLAEVLAMEVYWPDVLPAKLERAIYDVLESEENLLDQTFAFFVNYDLQALKYAGFMTCMAA